MAKFKIGDRVRIVKTGDMLKVYLNCEAVITSNEYFSKDIGDGVAGYVYDCNIGDFKTFGPSYCFEPIQKYDGNQVISWEECLWSPKGVKKDFLEVLQSTNIKQIADEIGIEFTPDRAMTMLDKFEYKK